MTSVPLVPPIIIPVLCANVVFLNLTSSFGNITFKSTEGIVGTVYQTPVGFTSAIEQPPRVHVLEDSEFSTKSRFNEDVAATGGRQGAVTRLLPFVGMSQRANRADKPNGHSRRESWTKLEDREGVTWPGALRPNEQGVGSRSTRAPMHMDRDTTGETSASRSSIPALRVTTSVSSGLREGRESEPVVSDGGDVPLMDLGGTSKPGDNAVQGQLEPPRRGRDDRGRRDSFVSAEIPIFRTRPRHRNWDIVNTDVSLDSWFM